MSNNDFQYDFDDRYNYIRSETDSDDRYIFGRSDDKDDDDGHSGSDDPYGRSDNDDNDRDEYAQSNDDAGHRYSFGRSDGDVDHDAYKQSDNDDDGYEYGAQPKSSEADENLSAVLQLQVGREEKIFSFDANGKVVSMGEIRANGTIKAERMDQDESYALYGDFVIKTETEGFGNTEFTAYADGDGDGRWAEVAEGYGQTNIASFVQMIPANYSNFG